MISWSVVTPWPDGRRTLGVRRGLRGAGLASPLAAEHAGLALKECRQTTVLLQNREFPWAVVQLYEFLAETADADGRSATAEEARTRARQVLVTNS